MNLAPDNINEKIKNAQKNWANGIINIGKCYLEKKDYIALTETFIEELYAFKRGKVLFKPTKASKNQFRKDKNAFISYFIGHNKISDEDKGFALEPWKDIQFDNFDFTVFKDIIISMGIACIVFLQFSPHNIGGASLTALNTGVIFGIINLNYGFRK